jgi:hypothetical protein
MSRAVITSACLTPVFRSVPHRFRSDVPEERPARTFPVFSRKHLHDPRMTASATAPSRRQPWAACPSPRCRCGFGNAPGQATSNSPRSYVPSVRSPASVDRHERRHKVDVNRATDAQKTGPTLERSAAELYIRRVAERHSVCTASDRQHAAGDATTCACDSGLIPEAQEEHIWE